MPIPIVTTKVKGSSIPNTTTTAVQTQRKIHRRTHTYRNTAEMLQAIYPTENNGKEKLVEPSDSQVVSRKVRFCEDKPTVYIYPQFNTPTQD